MAIYRNEASSSVKIPFVVLTHSRIQSYDDSNLKSIYFDIAETDEGETHLIVNARFASKSVIKRFRLQNMTLQIINPGKMHTKKTKLVLAGIESSVEIPFSNIFRRNWSRLIFAWILFIGLGLLLFAGGYIVLLRNWRADRSRSSSAVTSPLSKKYTDTFIGGNVSMFPTDVNLSE